MQEAGGCTGLGIDHVNPIALLRLLDSIPVTFHFGDRFAFGARQRLVQRYA